MPRLRDEARRVLVALTLAVLVLLALALAGVWLGW